MTSTQPSWRDMLAQLIAIPSVSSVDANEDMANVAVIDLLSNWLEAAGFSLERVPVPDQPGKVNLIATLGEGEGGLVLSGHTDTVPFNGELWRSNPFELAEANDRLFGLGVCDMKGFLALAIEAACRYRGADLKQPLIILATADEETGMSGAKALVEAGRPRARHAIIGEPTSMKPVRMHKGMMMDAIHVHGQSGHSSDPAFGANALDGMYKIIGELIQWRRELADAHHMPEFEPPGPTLNLGYIKGGDNPNRICGDCELGIDLRPLPGMDRTELRAAMRERLEAALKGRQLKLEFEVLFEGADPMHTAADADIVRFAEEATGTTARAVAFSTEAPHLTRLGADVVVLGPGNIEQAHQPDEYLEVSRVQPTLDLLQSAIERFCVRAT